MTKHKIVTGQGNIDGGMELKITIEGDIEDSIELQTKATKFLIRDFDLKRDFNGDSNDYNDFIEDLLLTVADTIGYESYYWNLPEEDKSYNEYEELVVSKKAKINLLEIIVNSMKQNYK